MAPQCVLADAMDEILVTRRTLRTTDYPTCNVSDNDRIRPNPMGESTRLAIRDWCPASLWNKRGPLLRPLTEQSARCCEGYSPQTCPWPGTSASRRMRWRGSVGDGSKSKWR